MEEARTAESHARKQLALYAESARSSDADSSGASAGSSPFSSVGDTSCTLALTDVSNRPRVCTGKKEESDSSLVCDARCKRLDGACVHTMRAQAEIWLRNTELRSARQAARERSAKLSRELASMAEELARLRQSTDTDGRVAAPKTIIGRAQGATARHATLDKISHGTTQSRIAFFEQL